MLRSAAQTHSHHDADRAASQYLSRVARNSCVCRSPAIASARPGRAVFSNVAPGSAHCSNSVFTSSPRAVIRASCSSNRRRSRPPPSPSSRISCLYPARCPAERSMRRINSRSVCGYWSLRHPSKNTASGSLSREPLPARSAIPPPDPASSPAAPARSQTSPGPPASQSS